MPIKARLEPDGDDMKIVVSVDDIVIPLPKEVFAKTVSLRARDIEYCVELDLPSIWLTPYDEDYFLEEGSWDSGINSDDVDWLYQGEREVVEAIESLLNGHSP